jgi:microcystin-dependent protein
MPDFGTDRLSLQNTTGAIQNNSGDPLLSTDDSGASSYAFGPAMSAGIYLGIQNGNIGAPPPNIGEAIAEDNPFPYFSITDSSSGRIVASGTADSVQASGYSIDFTATNGLSGDEIYLERVVSVPASRATTATFQPRGAWTAATNNANFRAFTRAQYLKADGTTTTGAAGTGEATGATIFAYNSTAREVQANPNTTGVAPTDAAFLLIRIGIRLTANITGTVSMDLVEVRLDQGRTQYILTDGDQPNAYGYGALFQTFGDIIIRPNETGLTGSNPQFRLKSSNGDIVLDASNKGTNGSAVTTGNIWLQHDNAGKLWIGGTAGSSYNDTNLYRSAADTLKTDDSLIVTGTLTVGGNAVVGIPAGVVQSYLGATSNVPTGWILANGASLGTATYPALFAVIGYSFGGSGASFSVPDLNVGFFLVGSTSTPGSGFMTGSVDSYLNTTWNHTHSTDPAAFNSAATTTSQIVASGSGAGPAALSHVHSINVPATTSSDAGPSDARRMRVVYIIKT